MVWMILTAMSALSLVLILRPLLRRGENGPSRAEYDTRIYKDQLNELERDTARGVINEEAARAARAEIARRLIAADEEAKATTPEMATTSGKAMAAIVGVTIPALALGLYAIIGSPHLPAQPGAKLQAKAKAQQGSKSASAAPDLNTTVAQLAARLKQHPDDLEGWRLYARSLVGMRRFTDAVAAYQRATTLAPKDANLWSQLAETQITAAGGSVTPAARQTLKKALVVDPAEPRARYYVGLAARQAGAIKQALKIWLDLEADSVPKAPWRKLLGERISKTAKDNGISANALATMRKSAGKGQNPAPVSKTQLADSNVGARPPGPAADDVKAAQQMSADDRLTMIRSMVSRLADKMKDDPNNAEGWLRLARSYEVFNEPAKSRDAYAKAVTLKPKTLPVLTAYAGAIAKAAKPGAPIPRVLTDISERILALQPKNGGALWFSGISKMEAGDKNGARERWTRLLAILDPKTTQHAKVLERIKALDLPAKP
jgi:cytochrome c-type biogenesis protein CcmH